MHAILNNAEDHLIHKDDRQQPEDSDAGDDEEFEDFRRRNCD